MEHGSTKSISYVCQNQLKLWKCDFPHLLCVCAIAVAYNLSLDNQILGKNIFWIVWQAYIISQHFLCLDFRNTGPLSLLTHCASANNRLLWNTQIRIRLKLELDIISIIPKDKLKI